MSKPKYPNIHIFLVQPLDKKIDREMIVYADSEKMARKAAAVANDSEQASLSDSIYLNEGLSICIEIEPEIIKVGDHSELVKLKYNEVIYDLEKDIAEKVIAENIL